MLTPDPTRRITTAAVAAHAWLHVGEPYTPAVATREPVVDWAAAPENEAELYSVPSSDFQSCEEGSEDDADDFDDW